MSPEPQGTSDGGRLRFGRIGDSDDAFGRRLRRAFVLDAAPEDTRGGMRSTTTRVATRTAQNSSATRNEPPAEARPRSRRSLTTKSQRQEGVPGEPRFPRPGAVRSGT